MKSIFSLLTSLNNGILILFGFAIGIILLPLDTYLHELGHYIAVKVLAPITPLFNQKLIVFIDRKNKLEGTTKSNYLKFLSDNKDNPMYHKYIRTVAIMGCLFTSLLWIVLIVLTSLFLVPLSNILYLLIGVFVTPLLMELLTFFFNDNSETSDLYIAKHPEKFKYRY